MKCLAKKKCGRKKKLWDKRCLRMRFKCTMKCDNDMNRLKFVSFCLTSWYFLFHSFFSIFFFSFYYSVWQTLDRNCFACKLVCTLECFHHECMSISRRHFDVANVNTCDDANLIFFFYFWFALIRPLYEVIYVFRIIKLSAWFEFRTN